MGTNLYIVTKGKSEWSKKYAKRILEINGQEQDVIDRIVEFGKENRVNGVLTYSEEQVVTTSRVARKLKLPHLNLETAKILSNKFLLRKSLDSTAITTIKSFKALDPLEAVEYSKDIGFPVVVKPSNGHSSIGVIKAHSVDEVYSAAEQILNFNFGGIIPNIVVEEYIDGPEVSIECFVDNGNPYVISITDKRLSSEPFFEETGHTVPSSLPIPVQCLFASYAAHLLTSVNFNLGIAHMEARLTERGPVVIEVGARLAGDLIPELVNLSTGISLPLIAAQLACGEKVTLKEFKSNAASIEFLIPKQSGIIKNILSSEISPNILRHMVWGRTGQVVGLPPERYLSRLGYSIAVGKSPKESLGIVKKSIDSTNVIVE